ncbi:atypical/PIKK/PI4K protein kinase [Cristinia sonorae]|uniref:1-phosphatidylinositol 4-kinase n=1 Tax=Cristinia sonorae TaxID=1940300 RepID=A0A8K0XNY1_9AGAR|nr:atypical/PIKK/PI4K protein kinase [Cristinia sonorae]
MDCLEFNIHQLILSDLATNIGDSKGDANTPEYLAAIDHVTSKVATRALSFEDEKDEEAGARENGNAVNGADGHERVQRVFMSNSRIHCNIGFAELSVNLPDAHVEATVPVLVDILRDIPYIDFDRCFTWDEWSQPDQLVYATVSALLRIASIHDAHRATATGAIVTFAGQIVGMLKTGDAEDVLTQFAPAFHGFYRSIISIPFGWSLQEWSSLSSHLNELFDSAVVDRLNRLLVDALRGEDQDVEKLHFIQTLLARYVARGRPLSGYFTVCCVIEALWTTLAQALLPSHKPHSSSHPNFVEAAAANKAWQSLLHHSIELITVPKTEYNDVVLRVMENAMQCFTSLLVQIEEMDVEPSEDTYAWETMSESLKLASVCSIATGQLDKKLYARVKLLLSDESPVSDNLVQEAALKSTAILVRNFPDIAFKMAGHIRKFITSPLPIFELDFAPGTRVPPPLIAAAKCLALCIDLAPGDDLGISYMYSLLNYIAATSKETHDTPLLTVPSLAVPADRQSIHSTDGRLPGLTEDEKRLIGISTISVVTRLALEFDQEEVTRLTISMLVQRLRSAEPTVEAAIAYNLVDLALAAPESAFADIIRVFSSINRSANPDDPRLSNNMVLAAQTRLARELHRRPELYELYLVELLTLFADKGVAIQNASTVHHSKMEDMTEQLASLLLPIDALLNHEDLSIDFGTSPTLIPLFRNMWFLCILFHFTIPDGKDQTAMSWQRPALARIAVKTPSIILEEARDTIVGDLDYNPVIRQEYAETVISHHRTLLHKHIPLRSAEIRGLSPGQIIFLLCMHDLESMRAAAGMPSSLVSYFTNNSLNKNPGLIASMEAVAEKVIRGSVTDLNSQASKQALPSELSKELRQLLVCSTHRIARVRDVASKYLNRLVTSFPSLMCDPPFVIAILEVLTLLRRACENAFNNEDNPIYTFHSDRAGLTLQLTDDYAARQTMLSQTQRDADRWFELALGRAPIELYSTLQKYLAVTQVPSIADPSDLGPTVALHFGKATSPVDRKFSSLSTMLSSEYDRSKLFVSQLAAKGYHVGQAVQFNHAHAHASVDGPDGKSPHEIRELKRMVQEAIRDIREKKSTLTVQHLKRLLFRVAALIICTPKCDHDLLHYLVILPFESFSPTAVSAGCEVWSWVIAEKPEYEVVLVTEITSAWITTIKHGRGMFSKSLNYTDPFHHAPEYSPSDKESVDRAAAQARRLLTPHTMVLTMLVSRLQAARYRKPSLMLLFQRIALASAQAYKQLCTHPLSREARFTFLLFGFETLRSSFLDFSCENKLRENLYATALSWFSVRPQWSYGANRVQIDADVKLLSEFLSYLQADTVRGYPTISSLAAGQSHKSSHYMTVVKNLNNPLRLLVDNEIFRLMVWTNPTNDTKRGVDHFSTIEKTMTDAAWTNMVRKTWQVDPAIAVYLTERFHVAIVAHEVRGLVRSRTRDVLDIPEALQFLVGDSTGTSVRRDLKYLSIWAPVPPVIAVTFFEKRYKNDPLLLQFAHRVLEQHPVELTFFFVPQVVQALRYDDLGYVARFIFETAKISQLFCHQIIWNMKANGYKDDAASVEDPLKPTLDRMIDLLVDTLSGEAKEFYEKEFGFFNEVTAISGKLKPYIKKTKPEKKGKIDEEMAKIRVEVGVYLPSNPDGKVVDIDKKSGRPLQSHAKAPFMATFKVRKERVTVITEGAETLGDDAQEKKLVEDYDIWQQAIFKVGDDCRQDVLALQVIAMFKNIFNSVGLTVYLYPYRVTATAPGCGVIDVVPNATSRDEMGRAKVNDLLDFFVAKYGGEDTVAFQKARLNFIQSMAAYSVACYILQIKDRHNGNIMIDGEGHIVHIDFGFLFDIGPGGVKFEPNSFKLTHEMVVLMGGRYSQGYQLFQQLTVKAFLAIRPHVDQLVSTVQLMLDTSLPSFKGEPTIKRLKDRFVSGLTERQAADYMMGVIKNAHENVRSTAYDEFQRLQNGIPYK